MADWVKVGTDVAIGGVAGAVDQLVQNADDKRVPAPGLMGQFGTYYNYGIPILAILGTAFGVLRGNMATRMVTVGAQLAGRKVTKQITKPTAASAWRPQRASAGVQAPAPAGVGIEF